MLSFLENLALLSAAGLLFTWAVYPALIGLAARRVRRAPAVVAGWRPTVSVVVATRAPAEVVRERVLDCLATAYDADRLQVVVALDRPTEAGELAELGPRVVVVPSRPGASGKAAALNEGVAAARGEVVVFADAHQRYAPETIPELVAGLADPRMGAVSGSLQLPAAGSTVGRAYWTAERWLRRREAEVHSSVGATGAVFAIRRALWAPLRPGLLLDDVCTPMQIVLRGFRVGFLPTAPAFELRTPTRSEEYRRKVRTLTGVVQLCAWLPRILSPVHNPIWAQFVCHKLLRMLTPYWALAVAAWGVAHVGLALGAALPVVLLLLVPPAAWVATTRHRWGARIRTVVAETVSLQAAVVVATLNSLRGRWQVWHG